jgi:hypothetical protein
VTARLEISRLAPARADPLRSVAGWFPCGARSTRRCRKDRAFLERDGDGARDRARAPNSTATAASRTRHFGLDRRRVAQVVSHGSRPNAAQKWRESFPACKPLKYHKTAKYSGADAVMRKPPAGSPPCPKARRRKSSRTALGQRGAEMEGKRENYPACKPLKYHKTGKSRVGAVVETASPGSPR